MVLVLLKWLKETSLYRDDGNGKMETENTVFFRAKKLMERWYLLNTEKCLFWTFQRWDIRFFLFLFLPFLSQNVDRMIIFTDYWKVLVLNFLETQNTVFFRAKKLMERDDIYWLLKSSCCELFGYGKYGLFFSEKVDICLVFLSSPWYSIT